jgi:hypothetical protein
MAKLCFLISKSWRFIERSAHRTLKGRRCRAAASTSGLVTLLGLEEILILVTQASLFEVRCLARWRT